MSALIALVGCEICKGRGSFQGVFHRLECAACNGGGLVKPTGEALDYPQLVAQLRLRLEQKDKALANVRRKNAEADIHNNKKGPFGSHFTCD